MLASSWRISENLDEKHSLIESIKPVDDRRNPHEDGGGLRGLGTVSVVTEDGVIPSLITSGKKYSL